MRNSLHLGCLVHETHDVSRRPIGIESSQETDHGDSAASLAEEADVFHQRIRAGVVDNKVDSSPVCEALDLSCLIRHGLLVETLDLRAQLLDGREFLIG